MNDFVKRVEAIKELYPEATGHIENKSFDNDSNEISLDETAIASKIIAMATAKETEATAKATAQASGNTKLLDLGLTQAEATALTGYTPE